MKELVLGLLGGGTLVQLINILVTLRPNRRQVNANALGAEVSALEKTINVLRDNMDSNEERYRQRVSSLQTEINELRQCRRELEHRVMSLERQIEFMSIKKACPATGDTLGEMTPVSPGS